MNTPRAITPLPQSGCLNEWGQLKGGRPFYPTSGSFEIHSLFDKQANQIIFTKCAITPTGSRFRRAIHHYPLVGPSKGARIGKATSNFSKPNGSVKKRASPELLKPHRESEPRRCTTSIWALCIRLSGDHGIPQLHR